jgi:hypothetical protein
MRSSPSFTVSSALFRLVFSSLVALLVVVLLLAYAPRYAGRQRIYLEDRPEIAMRDIAPEGVRR